MVIFEIKYKGRSLWLPEIAPGSVEKGHPYFFPEAHKTGKLHVFTQMEKARQFFQFHGFANAAAVTERSERIDLERLQRWSENPVSNDVEAEQLDAFYMLMVDALTEIPKDVPKHNEYKYLQQLNQQMALKMRHEILSKASRENPETSKKINWEKPNEEILRNIVKKPELKGEVQSLIYLFEEIIHIQG